jgi:hypothetical protein
MRLLIALLAIATILASCTDKQKKAGDMPRMNASRLEQDLEIVKKLRIYFGHQSVGDNIIEGMKEVIASSNAATLNFVTLGDIGSPTDGFFADSKIGKNGKPETKCDAYRKIIDGTIGDSLDIALMKFCFVDFKKETDVDTLFSYYKSTVAELHKSHPHVTFIHVTVPVTTREPAWRRLIKKIIGREDPSDLESLKRCEFNALLLQAYRNEPVFDLAGIESTYRDGTKSSFEYEGKTVFSMVEEYTVDGGHLNALGRNIVARELLHMLAQLWKIRPT